MTSGRDLSNIKTIVFDIGGTLLDSTGSTVREFERVLHDVVDPVATESITARVSDEVEQRMERISRGEQPFASETTLRRSVLPSVLSEHRARLNEEELEALINVGERFDAFPDAAQQLDALAQQATVIGLTNSALDQAAKASARTGLRWHALLGAQLAATYKPAPEAYALVPELLHVDPTHSLFVAAHPWDLRGANTAGFRTVYLPRPHTDAPGRDDEFDISVGSLDELADMLA